MYRIIALLLLALCVCSCADRRRNEDYKSVSANELAKLMGMMTFTADVSLTEGQSLHIGTFDKSGSTRGFAVFTPREQSHSARIVIGYWKKDRSAEAYYGYILPSGDNGTGTFELPQPYTGVTASTPAYRAGNGFAFLQFDGSETHLGYWITPNKPSGGDVQ